MGATTLLTRGMTHNILLRDNIYIGEMSGIDITIELEDETNLNL